MRRLLLAAALLALALPAHAGAAGDVRFGIQDDAWIASGPGTLQQRLGRIQRLGVDLVRFSIHWDKVAVRRPANGASHRDPAYDWRIPDAVLHGLRQRKIAAVVTLVGTPAWANGGLAPQYAPEQPQSFGDFAFAAATRYWWVRDWTVWNEPNQTRWLRPPAPSTYTVKLLNPGYDAIHRANPRARVAGGVTAPRANVGGFSPVSFIRGMRAAGARLDAYAHHPYPANRFETPFGGGCRGCFAITMANLELLISEVRKNFGNKRIWITEFGYQTNPPDRLLGVTQAQQARYIGEAALRVFRAPYVDMLVQYLYRDEPDVARFQSGLVTVGGTGKLSLRAFPLPLAQIGRAGGAAFVWGQVRPRAGRQPYRIQLVRGGSATWLGGTRRTNARGFLTARVTAPPGVLVRIWSPRDRAFSASLALR